MGRSASGSYGASPSVQQTGAARAKEADVSPMFATGEAGRRTFVNPANGHRESFSANAGVYAFFLGWFYLLAVGMWGHVFIQLFIVVVVGVVTGGPGAILAVPVVWIVYAIATPGILANRYLRQGWIEVSPGCAPPKAPAEPAAAVPAEHVAARPLSTAEELTKLAELRDKGVLTAEEFEAQKAKVLRP